MIAGKGAEVFKRPRLQPGLQGPGLEFSHFTLSVPVSAACLAAGGRADPTRLVASVFGRGSFLRIRPDTDVPPVKDVLPHVLGSLSEHRTQLEAAATLLLGVRRSVTVDAPSRCEPKNWPSSRGRFSETTEPGLQAPGNG